MLNSNSGKFPKFLAEMCKICTREDFISLLNAGCWLLAGCIHSGFLALECNQFANFRYFAAFANVQVFGSLAFFPSRLPVAGYRFHSHSCLPSTSILCYFYVTLESASNVVCLSGLSDRKGGRPCLALFLLSRQPALGYANDAWLPLGSWRMR